MTEDTRDHAIMGRRADDGVVRLRFNLKHAVWWSTLAVAVISVSGWAANSIGSRLVTPRSLKIVGDSVGHVAEQQETFNAIQTRQNARLSAVEARIANVETVMEILAIDACGRLKRSDLYAYRKANCAQYLEDK